MRIRLFIEGVEVPIIAASVQVAPNSPAACSIQIPPLPEGTRLFPRSLIHVFFLDTYDAQSPFPGIAGGAAHPTPTDYEDIQGPSGDVLVSNSNTGDNPDLRNAKYKLLFGGELVTFRWTKNQNNRSLVLQCMDWSNYWDYAYQWNNTDLFGPGVKALFSGGATSLFTDFLEDEGSAIIRIIQTPSVQYPKLKGLLGGIVHLLEAVGGSYYYGKSFAGQNIFFSIAELRLHITQMITAYEADPTASRLLSAGYDSLLGRTLGNLGQQVSIRSAINALMGIIFHETYAQCCPSYTPSSGNSPSGGTRNSVRKDSDNAYIATNADGLLTTIASVEKLLADPAVAAGGSSSSDGTSVLASVASMKAVCDNTANSIQAKSLLGARSFYASASKAFAKVLSLKSKWVASTKSKTVPTMLTYLASAKGQLQRAAGFEVLSSGKNTIPARLNQHIFRPDVWFSAPPRCNVFFPENYHSLDYTRSFLTEPTRLLLKTNNEFFGEDELFDQFYFAPKGLTVQKGGRALSDLLSGNGIFDHELFTGILPVFEKMGELNIFGARSGTVNGKMPKVGLAQRSTNFLYFKYRFAARQLTLSGKFNPYVAPGFPALVVDKYVNAETLDLREQLIQQNGGTATSAMNQLLGTHFLCNLTELSHTVDQNSGVTQINCSYARQPEESVEFLGAIQPDQKVHVRADTDATRVTVVAAIEPPQVNSLGPNNGAITAVQDVSQAYRAQTMTAGQKVPLYQGPPRLGTTQARISVPIGLTAPAGTYGTAVSTFIGDPNEPVTFRAFKVTEAVPRYRQETVDLPAEEYIRPGWYGDIWHPSLIGQAYQQFFQTGSITDQQQIDGGSQGSFGIPDDAAQAALASAAKATGADDPSANAPGLLALDRQASIQDAVAFIVQTYSYIKQQGLDVDEFIRTYTWRPIATMVDLFGTSDLALDQNGQAVVQGVEGFHSRAFGPHDDLFGLVTPNIETISGIKRGDPASQRADTRKRKQDAVLAYVSALQFARAILG